jgi:hypothetical protein
MSPTARIREKIKSDRLLTTESGSSAARAGTVITAVMVRAHTRAAYALWARRSLFLWSLRF